MSLCQCGCGQPAPIARMTNRRAGHRKGEPMRYVANHHPRPGRPPLTAEQALAQYVQPGAAQECWEWQGARTASGYGVAGVGGRQEKGHRIAYRAAHGLIPDGLVVRHSCDNPPCCNPAHLSLGTIADNNRDKADRGRQPVGERAYQALLTEQAVLSARTRWAAGESVGALALEAGVSESAMSHAVHGRSWKHLGATA